MSDLKCQAEYVQRIHKVQDYIDHHIGQPITVDELSEVAGFSKFHFSRIFQAMMRETLAHYVNRIRMEQASFLLAHRKDMNMTDITYELGFSDSTVFSRTYKNYYGISPKRYREEYSKNCKDSILLSKYNGNTERKERATEDPPVTGQISIEQMEEKQIVYVRHTGNYQSLSVDYGKLINTLFYHARMQGLLVDGVNWVLAIYHDNPEFGDEEQFRTSICMTVPKTQSIHEDGVLGRTILEGGMYAVGHFKIQPDQYAGAWDFMYREWLTGSGYVPRNSNPFEVYRNDPNEDENHVNIVDIYVPIEPAFDNA